MKNRLLDQILSITILIWLALDAIQIFNGSKEIVQSAFISSILSLIIILSLILCLVNVYNYRKKGFNKRATSLSLLYLLLSFFGFTFTYHSFVKLQVDKEQTFIRLNEKKQNIDYIIKTANSAYSNPKLSGLEVDDIKSLSSVLSAQILDNSSPGVGPRAKLIIFEIEKKLGLKLTIPSGSPKEVKEAFQRQIDTILESKVEQYISKYSKIIDENNLLFENIERQYNQVLSTPNLDDDKKLSAYLHNKSIEIVNESERQLGNKLFEIEKKIMFYEDWSISDSFSILIKGNDRYKTIALFSMYFSFILNVFPLILIWMVIYPDKREKTNTQQILKSASNGESTFELIRKNIGDGKIKEAINLLFYDISKDSIPSDDEENLVRLAIQIKELNEKIDTRVIDDAFSKEEMNRLISSLLDYVNKLESHKMKE